MGLWSAMGGWAGLCEGHGEGLRNAQRNMKHTLRLDLDIYKCLIYIAFTLSETTLNVKPFDTIATIQIYTTLTKRSYTMQTSQNMTSTQGKMANVNLIITSEEGYTASYNVNAPTLDAGIDSLLGWLTTISGAIEVKGLLRE